MVCEEVKMAAVQGAFNNDNIFSAKTRTRFFKQAELYFTPMLDSTEKILFFARGLLELKETKERLEKDGKIYNPEVATLVLYSMMMQTDRDGLKSFLVNNFANANTPLSAYVKDNITIDMPATEVMEIFVQYPSTITEDTFRIFVAAIEKREEKESATRTISITYGEKGGETRPPLLG